VELYRFWVWPQAAPKRTGKSMETLAPSEAAAFKNIWYRLADGKVYLIPRVKQEYSVELDREHEIKKGADAYRRASKGESMSKKNRKFDNLDTWRTTILNSVEDVDFVNDEENNQEVAYHNECVIGVFDRDLEIGTIREEDETYANRDEWEKGLGQDNLILTKDVEDNGVEVVIAKDQAGKIVGTYTDVNGVGRGVKVQESGFEAEFLAKDRTSWTSDFEEVLNTSKAEAEQLAAQLGGIAHPGFPDESKWVVSRPRTHTVTESTKDRFGNLLNK